MKVLVTGASGLIGTALRRSLESDDHDVTCLVRGEPITPSQRFWDPAAGTLDVAHVDGFDAVVHLAGAGIGDRRWSDERKRLILDSRVQGTELLTKRLASADSKPRVLISGSAIGFYGDRTDPVTEDDGSADPPDFLSDVCVAWEDATADATAAGIRTVPVRTGLVLAKSGGALGKLLLPFRLGVGGRLGSGETWWSWITLDDHVRAIRHLIEYPVKGPVNLTAPNPATNAEVTKALGKALSRPTVLPVPRAGLRLLLGKELADALLFTSNRVLPAKLEASGFKFAHSTIDQALRAVLD
ncbi:MAG: TIGR01777 family protein [bacterium]|nr:TIGR01777 family protein [bacterium]MCP4966376.1 TIGR01777 family protein [bacterium]